MLTSICFNFCCTYANEILLILKLRTKLLCSGVILLYRRWIESPKCYFECKNFLILWIGETVTFYTVLKRTLLLTYPWGKNRLTSRQVPPTFYFFYTHDSVSPPKVLDIFYMQGFVILFPSLYLCQDYLWNVMIVFKFCSLLSDSFSSVWCFQFV